MKTRAKSTSLTNLLHAGLLAACMLVPSALYACASPAALDPTAATQQGLDTSHFVSVVEDEPDTVDFQCTSLHYAVGICVFDRLVETETDANGDAVIVPSLAESWDVSADGRVYTFHLRKGVSFSNGRMLTASDVLYTFTRLLTHPDSCNRDIVEAIEGADELESGEADRLAGFRVLDDYAFEITLEQPFEAFLACLSMPGASILDKETTEIAQDRFGKDVESTVGTGPYIFQEWTPKQGMLFVANPNCWSGSPQNEGVNLRFAMESEEVSELFDDGKLDVLDLSDIGAAAEFYIHGDIYQDRLYQVPMVSTTYFALNSSLPPLDDVRVRKALQLALDREALLQAVYDGSGSVVNGIYPPGLNGYNPDLPEIPYDPDKAKKLLAEAGYPDGFDLAVSVKATSSEWEMSLVNLVVSMWKDVGVRASVDVPDEDEFMNLRKAGKLASYTATWTADYDDPDNFVYTFFGNSKNSTFRSLCYQRDDVMDRVRNARMITDADERIGEYWDLEREIAQDDAAWIPLFSRTHVLLVSNRVSNLQFAWNGAPEYCYRDIVIEDAS